MNALYFTEVGRRYGLGHFARYQAISNLIPELNMEIVLSESSDPEYLRGAKTWSNSKRLSYQKLFDRCDVLFVDTYIGDDDFFKATNAVGKVIYLDDYLNLNVKRGLVVDWTAGAESYRVTTGEKSLFGLKYLVTRPGFKISARRSSSIKPSKILTIFGGSDPSDLTPMFFDALRSKFDIRCVGTSMYPCFEKYKDKKNFRFDLSVDELVGEILSSDLVISAGGQALYEVAALGIPIIAVSTADNQNLDVAGFHKLGLAKELNLDAITWEVLPDWLASIKASELAKMSERMASVLSDGTVLRDEMLKYISIESGSMNGVSCS